MKLVLFAILAFAFAVGLASLIASPCRPGDPSFKIGNMLMGGC